MLEETKSKMKAVEYVRMSTEHQQYSTQNQSAKIQEYADSRNIEIVRTYADEGRSGLSIGGRAALQELIAGVEGGTADFDIILVYDVSRWGRFQDADESAYYEYICRRAGIQVAYCAEQFENDGSPVSTIVKGVKRAMAGEYSRELSAKVFAGQCRLIELGYRQGGPAGYGLRRMLVDQHGKPKGELKVGEHKSLLTDRVILIPGPSGEVDIVNQMFGWLVDEDLSIADITRRLNGLGILTDRGRPWSINSVRQILTNEKYIGNNVYNRRSFKLKRNRVVNPPEMWVRKESAFDGIVPVEVFEKAQQVLKTRRRRFSNEELLERLKRLYKRHDFLSAKVIDQATDMPSAVTIGNRFGSLVKAYEMVGFIPTRDLTFVEVNRHLRQLHPEIYERAEKTISELGGSAERDPETGFLHLNGELAVNVVLARCQSTTPENLFWNIRLITASQTPDVTVAVRLAPDNESELDYYLFPRLDLPAGQIRINRRNSTQFECFRHSDLSFFYGMSARNRITHEAGSVTLKRKHDTL